MAITIKHLKGPLAGEVQRFDDSVDDITFGRSREEAEVVYPPECDIVGRVHCRLKQTSKGNYCVELTDNHYVAIDGTEADNNAPVRSGSTFTLGNDEGPSFEVAVEKPKREGKTTKPNKPPTLVRKKLREITQQGAYALTALAVLLIASGAYFYLRTKSFEQQIAGWRTEERELAKQQFSQAVTDNLMRAVYLVVKDDAGVPKAEATAWAFAPDKLATNAHVTEAIAGARPGTLYLLGPDGGRIEIKNAKSHPGYLAFKAIRNLKGVARGTAFTPLDLTSAYDVGIIEVDPEKPLPATLKLASNEDLAKLAIGIPVASAGFPSEGLVGSAALARAPAATQRLEGCLHVPGRRPATAVARPAQRARDGWGERQPDDRRERQGHCHCERRERRRPE
jgi:hypothetical protein